MRNPFARVANTETARVSLRDRAVTLKASAARVMKRQPAADPAAAVDAAPSVSPSPALTAMVAEWERLLRIENSADLTDEEMKPICDARHRVHGEICAFPAASIADLAAKLPLFRDEIVASEPSRLADHMAARLLLRLRTGSHPMKTAATMRATLALGLPSSIALGLGQMRRLHRVLLARAGHEAGRRNVITAAILVAVYLAS